MDLLEFVSNLGIVSCAYIVIFTSKVLTKNVSYDDHTMYIIGFATLHFLFLTKYILAEVIEDEPAWVGEDRDMIESRVEQVMRDNQDKKLWEYISKHYEADVLLSEVMEHQHKDQRKAFKLVKKLKAGCE